MPKKIDEELKARAVRLVNDHLGEYPSLTAAAAAVAKQLGVGKESVRRWVVQAQVDGGRRPGATSEELVEIKALKFKVRRLEEDNAVLKAATVFFGAELCRGFHDDVLAPLLAATPHAAGLLGAGSDVLGHDDERSTDHDWGPRATVLVAAEDLQGTRADLGVIPWTRMSCRRTRKARSGSGWSVGAFWPSGIVRNVDFLSSSTPASTSRPATRSLTGFSCLRRSSSNFFALTG